LPGLITLLKDGQMMGMWDLSSIGKAIVVLGGKGADMVLPGASVPAVVARIVAQATVDGRTQAVWELLDPADPEVVLERQTLEHGDELLVFKNIRLEYSRYEAETGTFLEGEVIHV
jgi:hypothetical protein